jgi:hypothetical protein
MDATGKMILQKQVSQNTYLIDGNTFKTNGIYFINVLTNKGTLNKKVVISR